MKEKNQSSPAEIVQHWADLQNINFITYSVEVSSPEAYFKEYASYPQYNYWEWFVVPSELIYTPSFKILFKPSLQKRFISKKKPLLLCNRTIVPLRI
jgi:hypothetical protein